AIRSTRWKFFRVLEVWTSRFGLSLGTLDGVHALAPFVTPSVALNLILGGLHLMSGLLLGVLKYYQIHTSSSFTAHPYISTAHRAARMYGFASFQLAGVALLSAWTEPVNTLATTAATKKVCVAIVLYTVHGIHRDTTNQLKRPKDSQL
ncbi:hypothetical protein BGZ65_010900, partial [Modicella reniformis]